MKSNRTVSVVTIVGLGLALLLWASPGLAQVLSLDGVNATLAGTDLGSYSTIQNSEWDGNNSPPVGYPYGTATLNVDTTSADASYGGLLLDSPTDTSGSFGMYNEDLNVGALNLNKIGTGTLTLVGGLAYSDTTYIGANILYTGNTTVSAGTLVFQNAIYTLGNDYPWAFSTPATSLTISAAPIFSIIVIRLRRLVILAMTARTPLSGLLAG